MRVGVNLPDGMEPVSDLDWALLRRLNVQQFTVSSRTPRETLEQLIANFPQAAVHVKPWIKPGTSPWPSHILDYRPGQRVQSLGECLELLRRGLRASRVHWVGGAEQTSTGPVPHNLDELANVWPLHREAALRYAAWWSDEVSRVQHDFPGIPVAVAPLTQGSPELEWRWFRLLKRLGSYDVATYLADHNRFLDRPFSDREWGARGIALRELLPELGLIHNLEAHDGGRPGSASEAHRANVYARYLRWCERSGSYACVSLFTVSGLPGGQPQLGLQSLAPAMLSAA